MVDMKAYYFDFQLFAAEKTEKATPKKRREAREKGQVLRSAEMTSAFLLLSTFLVLGFIFPRVILHLKEFMSTILDQSLYIEFTNQGVHGLNQVVALFFVQVMWPVFLTAFVVALVCNYLQVGFALSTDPLKLKLDRLNPFEGMKRIFSRKALVELCKSLGKISIVGGVTYYILWGDMDILPTMVQMPLPAALGILGGKAVALGIRCGLALIAIGILDYAYQWWDYEKNLRMSKQEVKDEHKQTEGNPEIRGRQREVQRALTRQRMLQEVPQADVIITNPTQYAVALKYDHGREDAPRVIAKGKMYLAQKIKDIASEHKIPTVRDVFVAQTLYRTTEIGDTIPEELYQAVAEILAFVYRLQNRG